ncbi:MAG: tetratricopeptide repeat protein [Spirochaetales bacterium]|nr:tetratricopeptide repeat protein [Spirochaetales bacterium]
MAKKELQAKNKKKKKLNKPQARGGGKGFLILIIFSTLIILAGMFFLNDIILAIRLFELENYLREINREAANIDTLGMVTKYKLQLQLYRDKITEEDFNKEELNSNYLITEYENQKSSGMGKYEDISKPVIAVINILRFFMDKPPINSTSINPANTQLAVAYYHERNKNYKKALEVYDLYLEQDLIPSDKQALVKLHQGYCYSIISEYDKAVDMFKGIMRDHSEDEVAVTAALLLQYLETILNEINLVKSSGGSAIEKSEKLYRLMAYDEAEKQVSDFSPESAEQEEQLKFIKARIYEEKGDKSKSVEYYQELIQDDPESDAAKLANRRILLIATTSDESEELKELAQLNNALIEDEDFSDLMETTEKIEKAQEETSLKETVKAVEEKVEIQKAISAPVATETPESTLTPVPADADATTDPDAPLATEDPVASGTLPSNEPEEEKISLSEIIKASRDRIEEKIEEEKPEILAAVNRGDFEAVREASTPRPTEAPTPEPTALPTAVPTERPTFPPTPAPTIYVAPTATPVDLTPVPVKTLSPVKKPYEVVFKNDLGNIYKVEHYNEKDELLYYYEYVYDNDGKPLRVNAYDARGNLLEEY